MAGGRIVDVHAFDFGGELAVFLLFDFHVRLAEHHEQVACAGLLQQFVAHREVGIHARGHDGEFAVAFHLLGHVRVKGEAADDEQIKPHALHGFLGGFLHQVRADRAVFRADAHGGAARLAALVRVIAGGVQPCAGERIEPVEFQPLLFTGVLDAGFAEVVQNHRGEIVMLAGFLFGNRAVAVLVRRKETMRRQAFHRERAGDAEAFVVFVRLVVEQFRVGVAGDGGVNLRALHAGFNVGIVGDGFERDVRYALVNETAFDVAFGCSAAVPAAGSGSVLAPRTGGEDAARTRRRGRLRYEPARHFHFLAPAVFGIGQQIKWKLSGHQTRACQRNGNSAGVASNPTPSPLLRDVSCRAAAASRIEHQIAGIGRHHQAALDNSRVSLDNIKLIITNEAASSCICPDCSDYCRRIVIPIPHESERFSFFYQALGMSQSF